MKSKESKYLQLIAENQRMLIKISSFYTDSADDKKDLQQEIAYQVWKSMDSFKDQSKQSTWLYRIAINTSIQFLKKSKRQRAHSSELDDKIERTLEAPETNNKEAEVKRLMTAVQKLKELDKAIILLYLEEKSHEEIGEILNLSKSNVGTRIQRIKIKLKELLKHRHNGH